MGKSFLTSRFAEGGGHDGHHPRQRTGRSTAAEDAGPAVHGELIKVRDALNAAAETGRAWRRRIDSLAPADRQVLLYALGHGEVSAVISGADGEGEVQVLETVLPGIWIGRASLPDGSIGAQWVEVGDAPRVVRELALTRPRTDLPVDALTAPRGAMNVMSVLAEVRDRSTSWEPGTPNHVMNFTLFPMTPADSAFLAKVLGESGVRIASGGYGAARIVMTGIRHVWAVQYLNGLGDVILDTLEIGHIPDAVLASREDFEDSAVRLGDISDAYAP
ncbi:MAG: hydrogenase expression/formation protein [Pseudomonadota bacterium]